MPRFLIQLCSIIVFLFISSTAASYQTELQPTLQYIVTFLSYHPLSDHEASLRSALLLAPPTSWRVLERSNIATSFPTDFVVLETADISIVSMLNANPLIRNVAEQTEHTRHTKAIRLPTDVDERESYAVNDFQLHLTLHPFNSGSLWRRGYTGQGVSIAVFDTGLIPDHKYFPNLVSETDWTGENTTHDRVGHGTFVAGIIAGHHPSCPGLAPGANLHVFRVFTAAQVSYTSWFLDAFNYALHIGIDVLNLSIGGPDFADSPFTEKIDELAAHGIIAVSAIGNDGPLWGSLNNPGDMMPVVGVGGAEPDGRVASFSSRGMTTHELDHLHQSYGRVKPDVVAYARSLIGPSHRVADQCKRLSGTSVASPVVAGAIALIASTIPLSRRRRVVNPASVKRALASSAHRLSQASMYEQGAGLLDIEDAYRKMQVIDGEFRRSEQAPGISLNAASRALHPWEPKVAIKTSVQVFKFADKGDVEVSEEDDISESLESVVPPVRRRLSSFPSTVYETIPGPRAAFFPPYYDLRTTDCTYMWPHCAQPLFEGAISIHFNVTILNPAGIEGMVEQIVWEPGQNGQFLRVVVTPPHRFWPWTAGMGIHLSAVGIPSNQVEVEGMLRVRILSVHEKTFSDIGLPIKANVVPPPAKEKRLLWDMYHSMRYPPGYVPRDSLAETKDMLDWLGDHPHTNYHMLFRELINAGFVIDILDQPFSCLNVGEISQYGGILILDSEDYFSLNDTNVLEEAVKLHGVSLLIAAEWFNLDVMQAIRFEDDNTRSWWSPVIAGGNIPALNQLLARFEIGFGEEVVSGDVKPGVKKFLFESGVPIVRFPPGGELLYASGLRRYDTGVKLKTSMFPAAGVLELAVLGLAKVGAGAVLALGDTNCLDTAYAGAKCYSFFVEAIQHTINECAGSEQCSRMLQQSGISTHGLQPSTSVDSIDREAKELPESLLKVFKPHSKYDLQWICALGGQCVIKPVLDEIKTCSMRTGLQVMPKTDTSHGRGVVSLPLPNRAIPIGSETNYYKELSHFWWSEMGSDNRNFTRSDGGPTIARLRLRSLSLIFLGISLMFGSISLRRMGQRGSRIRRHGRGKTLRPRFADPSLSTRRVGASSRDMLPGQTGSSTRITCSSSSSPIR